MIAIGTDIVYIRRLEEIVFPEKLLHQPELRRGDDKHRAGIIALKEACFKALQIKPRWLEIEVKYKENGQPYLVFSDELDLDIIEYSCSISHDGDYALAVAVFQLRD
jgi:phosphopantetheine--protein transferase-like protein